MLFESVFVCYLSADSDINQHRTVRIFWIALWHHSGKFLVIAYRSLTGPGGRRELAMLFRGLCAKSVQLENHLVQAISSLGLNFYGC